MKETVKIQVIFEEEVNGHTYRDAIYYPDMATYQAKVSNGSHDTEKQARITSYDNAIKNPPVYVPPTKAELQAQKAELQAQIAILDVEIGKK